MKEFVKKTDRVAVPRGVGLNGLLQAIREVFKSVRIDSLSVAPDGTLAVVHWVPAEDSLVGPLEVSFSDMTPSDVLSRIHVQELNEANSLQDLAAELLKLDGAEKAVYAYAVHSLHQFSAWMSGHGAPSTTTLFGAPILEDSRLLEDTLVVFAMDAQRVRLADGLGDCTHVFKVALAVDSDVLQFTETADE